MIRPNVLAVLVLTVLLALSSAWVGSGVVLAQQPYRQQQTTEKPAVLVEEPQASEARGAAGVPVVLGGEEVLRIRAKLGPYSPDRRVSSIEQRLKSLEEDRRFRVESITTREIDNNTDIIAGTTTIMTVTDLDAQSAGAESRQALAKEFTSKLKAALRRDLEDRSITKLLMRLGLTIGTTFIFIFLLVIIGRLFPFIYRLLDSARGTYIRSIKFQQAVLLSENTFTDVLVGLCRLLRLALVLFLLSSYLVVVLSFYPETKDMSDQLLGWLLKPIVEVVCPSIVSYLPNVAFIIIIIVSTHYVISFTHFIFREIERGTISFPSFDPEWADPTYKIVRFLVIAFGLVLVFPYLPGSGSPAFQQVSIFLGILISLGSSGAISHIVAGVFLTYTGAFKIGDRVKIADTVGDVVQKTLLATRIKTIKHEYITIPNGMVLGSHIINYSSSAQNAGLILHTTVTIGYDVPWKTVHQLLIDAAMQTQAILAEPKPFVLQTSLGDFNVSYQLNAYTNDPQAMAVIYSDLHQNIQNKFNEAGVEIMSPHYSSLRDGNQTTIPQEYLSKDYVSPSFTIDWRGHETGDLGQRGKKT